MPGRTGGGPIDFGPRSDIAKSISVQGDALIAAEVKIENYKSGVAALATVETISALQAAQIGARASSLANDEKSLEDILTWLSAKFGVPGYLSIPAAAFDNAMTYLEARVTESLREVINQREHG